MQSTKISNNFIDNFFKSANPSFIIVYIVLLRLCGEEPLSVSRAADYLGVMENDILRALNFWRENGAIAYEDKNSVLEISFLLEQEGGDSAAPGTFSPETAIAASRPVYSQKEIDYCLESSPGLRQLFKSCQNLLGKPLSYNDMCVLFSFHDWLRFSFELIELLVEYCCSNERRSIRYIEKVAIIWADAGINTLEKARARIKLYNHDFRRIMSAMGKEYREPVKAEEEYMLKWRKNYGLPMDVIEAACEKTVLQASRPTFKYCDGIIENWVKLGVASMEDVERCEADFRAQKPAKRSAAKTSKPNRTKFSNFKEREMADFSEIQRIEMERIDRELGLSSGD